MDGRVCILNECKRSIVSDNKDTLVGSSGSGKDTSNPFMASLCQKVKVKVLHPDVLKALKVRISDVLLAISG
ncbi:hypothetical protein H5410_004144 [Solanum commersonii]|uniref:Uncharacterized protein n=1 Tax=Solanum commersonii TaxID=4109 RepID=A0A9J6B746_SOLCO|nr:hypothetical protein H5410_004144 [Solanum commersonii]